MLQQQQQQQEQAVKPNPASSRASSQHGDIDWSELLLLIAYFLRIRTVSSALAASLWQNVKEQEQLRHQEQQRKRCSIRMSVRTVVLQHLRHGSFCGNVFLLVL